MQGSVPITVQDRHQDGKPGQEIHRSPPLAPQCQRPGGLCLHILEKPPPAHTLFLCLGYFLLRPRPSLAMTPLSTSLVHQHQPDSRPGGQARTCPKDEPSKDKLSHVSCLSSEAQAYQWYAQNATTTPLTLQSPE